MSQDALNEEQFEGHLYHGTVARPDIAGGVTPVASSKWRKVNFGETDPEYAYATSNLADAWHYAELAWGTHAHGHPRVFRVKARGPIEKDPSLGPEGRSRGGFEHDVRSRHGFDVLGEEEMPKQMGRPEEWR
jgi:hypothetical protein